MENPVFEKTKIADIQLKNKIIRSATHEGMADEKGYPTDKIKKKYIQLAKGGVGAIITGYAGIQQNGKSSLHRMLMINSENSISYYKDLVEAVHEFDVPIILQIAHCGRQTRSKIIGEHPVAPSAIKDKFFSEEKPKELTENEILEIINNFVKAVERAKKADFDGVQLHLAHGYLLAEFLSPYTNRRSDKWGGSTKNRFRIVAEILKQARERVGNFPILAKINGYDGRKNGMRMDEAIKITKLLEESGCSAIEVSCGVVEDGFFTIRGPKLPVEPVFQYTFKYKKLPKVIRKIAGFLIPKVTPVIKPLTNYNVNEAQAIKENVSIPVIVVGGIKSLSDITEIIAQKKADFVSMCRPFIIEPNIVKKFKEGKQDTSKCIACNYCAIAGEEAPLKCYNGKL